MRVILLWLISLNLLLHGTEAIILPLRDGWTLVNENKSEYLSMQFKREKTHCISFKGIEITEIKIPSGVYSDLESAGITESVLFSFNDVALRWIGLENWTYSLEFNMTAEDLDHKFVVLNFDGLDTLAEIYLNDQLVGSANNMFTRYRFDVKEYLLNVSLTTSFNLPKCFFKVSIITRKQIN
jgi:beta-galactosidase/beta-glucuronidase